MVDVLMFAAAIRTTAAEQRDPRVQLFDRVRATGVAFAHSVPARPEVRLVRVLFLPSLRSRAHLVGVVASVLAVSVPNGLSILASVLLSTDNDSLWILLIPSTFDRAGALGIVSLPLPRIGAVSLSIVGAP